MNDIEDDSETTWQMKQIEREAAAFSAKARELGADVCLVLISVRNGDSDIFYRKTSGNGFAADGLAREYILRRNRL